MPGAISLSQWTGSAAIVPIRHTTTAFSTEAQTVQRAADEVLAFEEQSFALFGPKAGAISQIWTLVNECDVAGWNGDSAEPLSDLAAAAASDFIRALPEDI